MYFQFSRSTKPGDGRAKTPDVAGIIPDAIGVGAPVAETDNVRYHVEAAIRRPPSPRVFRSGIASSARAVRPEVVLSEGVEGPGEGLRGAPA
jgi:hypothetical protein